MDHCVVLVGPILTRLPAANPGGVAVESGRVIFAAGDQNDSRVSRKTGVLQFLGRFSLFNKGN